MFCGTLFVKIVCATCDFVLKMFLGAVVVPLSSPSSPANHGLTPTTAYIQPRFPATTVGNKQPFTPTTAPQFTPHHAFSFLAPDLRPASRHAMGDKGGQGETKQSDPSPASRHAQHTDTP